MYQERQGDEVRLELEKVGWCLDLLLPQALHDEITVVSYTTWLHGLEVSSHHSIFINEDNQNL